MRLRVLGTLEFAGGSATPLRSPKLRRLLAALVARTGAVVSVDKLADVIWGDALPVNVDGALHNLVSRLRAALPPEIALLTRAPGYLLEASREDVDAARFEDLATQARTCPPQRAAALLDEALALWHGPAYAEFAHEDFARPEAIRLEELRAVAVEDRVEAALALGRSDEAVARLEVLVADHPLRERPHAQLMLALYRLGRQAEALRTYREYRERLDSELGLEPSAALQRLEAEVLRHDPALDASPVAPRVGNLPAEPPDLIGRDEALAEVAATLSNPRIVTLVGPGGVGKTSLALSAAHRVAREFTDGAWLAELASVADPETVADVLATILGVQQRQDLTVIQRLVEYLRPKRLLLVMDNCEHLVDAVARLVDAVARECPKVRVLATSREPLDVDREHVYAVAPLAPAPSAALFVTRATAAAPGFARTDGDAAAVTDVCRRLDGLPLAVELAASRMRSLSPSEVAERLPARFGLLRSTKRLVTERHRTLRAVVDWSYDLLDRDQRRVFDRLSVFAGSFQLAAAERVAGDAVLLAELVDKSMVMATREGDATRYALLETLRAYGRERLAERGETGDAQREHAAFYVAFAEDAGQRLRGPSTARWADAITRELDDLRAAHAWAVATDLDLALRLVAALVVYAETRMPAEVFGWAERTIAAAEASGTASALLPTVYGIAASGARFRGDLRGAVALAQRGLSGRHADDPARRYPLHILAEVALFEGRLREVAGFAAEATPLAIAAGDHTWEVLTTSLSVLARAYSGDVAGAISVADQTCARADLSEDPLAIAWARYTAGEVRLEVDPGAAVVLLQDALDRAGTIGERYLTGAALVSLTSAQGRHGDPRRALGTFRDVIEHWHGAGNWTSQWNTIRNVVELLVRVELDEPAAALYGAVTTRSTAAPVFGADADHLAEARRILAARLNADAFAAAAAKGQAMADDDVVTFACAALDRAGEDMISGARR